MKKFTFKYIIFLTLVVFAFGCASTEEPIIRNYNFDEPIRPDSRNITDDHEKESINDSDKSSINKDIEVASKPLSVVDSEYIKAINSNGSPVSDDDNNGNNGEKQQNFLDIALEFCEASQGYWAEGNIEGSIEALDQAYSIILKVDTEKHPELIQPSEDLRFMISKRILEIYASRHTVANGTHKAIPLVMNEHVEKEIKSFQGKEKKFFMESYQRSGRYRQEMLKKLQEAGLPEELSWLPLIESGFKVRALSRARALGLWQFIPSTGYKFGLSRDAWIDERLDPEKATDAAIAYLKELHQIFGDWSTVLAGYNCGEMRVLRVIRQQKVNYLDNFWDLYQRLPRETARYVPRFIATLHIMKDPAKYGFDLGEPDKAIPYEVVSIEKQIRLKDVAENLEVTYEELKAINPELRYQTTPPTQYELKVPQGKGEVLLAKLDEIKKWTPPQSAYTYHRVRKGETLSTIAGKYGSSVQKIVWANNIRRKHFIRVGQKLKIPISGGAVSSRYASAKPNLLPDGTYRVRKGDSLWLIAQWFKTSTNELKKLNNLKSTTLAIGQILKVKNL